MMRESLQWCVDNLPGRWPETCEPDTRPPGYLWVLRDGEWVLSDPVSGDKVTKDEYHRAAV